MSHEEDEPDQQAIAAPTTTLAHNSKGASTSSASSSQDSRDEPDAAAPAMLDQPDRPEPNIPKPGNSSTDTPIEEQKPSELPPQTAVLDRPDRPEPDTSSTKADAMAQDNDTAYQVRVAETQTVTRPYSPGTAQQVCCINLPYLSCCVHLPSSIQHAGLCTQSRQLCILAARPETISDVVKHCSVTKHCSMIKHADSESNACLSKCALSLKVTALQAEYEAKIKSLKGLRASSRHGSHDGQVTPCTHKPPACACTHIQSPLPCCAAAFFMQLWQLVLCDYQGSRTFPSKL